MITRERQAFVITPLGVKRFTTPGGELEIDFDAVFNKLIKPAVEYAGFAAFHGAEIDRAGDVMQHVYEEIAKQEVVIADITGLNPNVMYELGVRHAVREKTTILVRCKDVDISAFDIQGLRYIDYPKPPNGDEPMDPEQLRVFRDRLKNCIANPSEEDNHAFGIIDRVRKQESKGMSGGTPLGFRLRSAPQLQIWLYPGNIRDVHGIDVWVNPENTAMQMARFCDPAISATIRFYGSEYDEETGSRPRKDTIAIELRKAMGKRPIVEPGLVLVTGAGRLEQTNGVRKIFHVAAVQGYVGQGYRPVEAPGVCVRNVLEKLKAYPSLRSVVFPMFGTGNAGARIEDVAPELIKSAIDYLRPPRNTNVEKVGFVAYSQRDFDVCTDVLNRLANAGELQVIAHGEDTKSVSLAESSVVEVSPVEDRLGPGEFFRVVKQQVRYTRPNGTMSDAVTRLSFERGDSVAAVVVDTRQKVVFLTRQFRYPAWRKDHADAFLLELPAGSVPPNESPEECVRREMEEELGYRVTFVSLISTFYVSPGGTSERIYVYYAEIDPTHRVSPGGGVGDEEIEVVPVPIGEVPELLASGSIIDAKTLIGLTWLADKAPRADESI